MSLVKWNRDKNLINNTRIQNNINQFCYLGKLITEDNKRSAEVKKTTVLTKQALTGTKILLNKQSEQK